MIGGQMVDMESEGNTEVDFATVQFIHTHKTGLPIKACRGRPAASRQCR
jgi:geranylgeranyl diphosphate synthase type II